MGFTYGGDIMIFGQTCMRAFILCMKGDNIGLVR